MRRCLPLLVFSGSLLLGSTVQVPNAGAVRYPDGSVHPLFGVSRALVVGQPILQGVTAVAFGDAFGIVATDTGFSVVDRTGANLSQWNGDSQNALLSIQEAPLCAIVWLPLSDTIVRFSPGTWQSVSLTAHLNGQVLAVHQGSDTTAQFLLNQDGQISEAAVDLQSGDLVTETALPNIKAPATYWMGGILYQDDDSLVFVNGTNRIKVASVHGQAKAFEPMSRHALHFEQRQNPGEWMLEFSPRNGLVLSQLPAPQAVPLGGGQ